MAPISAEARQHLDSLRGWAAQAAARGDMETSERLQRAMRTILDHAVAAANPHD